MTFSDFKNINKQFESESTLIRTATLDGKSYCLKSYKGSSEDSYKKDKITKEAEIMNKLYSDNSSLLQDGENFVLCYPYIEGMALGKFLKIWEFSIPEFLSISISIAKVMNDIHKKNIIHLDLNPGNIIYDTVRKKISIIDFGSSKQHDAKSVYLGNPERVECDLNYISPEQTGRINRVVDLRTDLYALGALMYEMATGKKLFLSDNALELVHCHIAKTPPSIRATNQNFPEVLELIINNLLSKNVEDRYYSDFGLIRDLENCLEQYQKSGEIKTFKIAQFDDSDKLRISQKSYGREDQIERMEKAFIRAKNGSKELIFIEGQAGTGKSNLVAENHRLLAENNSIFIEGKFDQVNQNIPFSAWVQVFDSFFKLILTETDEVLEEWKERIKTSAESNLDYLSIVIPNIKWLFNDIEEESNEYTTETQDRLKVTIKNIIKGITQYRTLVIFIDDWQWADHASIQLLKFLLESNEIQNILFIAAYRDNEITSKHHFYPIINTYSNQDSSVNSSTLSLNKLTPENTLDLLMDTFSMEAGFLNELNKLIYSRTQGNPFFFVQYLKAIASENLFHYNHELKKWEWDINILKNRLVSDDIVSLLVAKINVLDNNEKVVLQKAACIGSSVDLDLLSIICNKSHKDIFNAIENSLHEGLVQQSEFIEISKSGKRKRSREIRFSHDRIQQGIYNTLSEKEISKTHYDIGKILLQQYTEQDKEKNIFVLANHLNKSDVKTLSAEEIYDLVKINFQASERAKKLVDFQNGFSYVQKGLSLLGNAASTEKVYELFMPLQLQRYEIASFMDFQKELPKWERIILESNPNKLDLIKFHKYKIRGQISQGQIEDAIDTGLRVLDENGLKIKKRPTKFDIILSFIKTSRSYDKKKIHELVNLEPINDPIQRELTEIAMVLNVACYFSNKDLWAIVMSEITRLYIKNGITPLSPLAFAGFGSILIIGNQDISGGVAFGKLALAVQERFNATVALSKTLFSYYALIDWWVNPIQNAVDGLDKTMHISKNTGDFQYYGHAATIKSIYLEEAGMHLLELKTEAIRLLDAMEHSLEKVDVYLARQRISKISCLSNPNMMTDGLKSEHYDFELEKAVHVANKQNEIITINHLDTGMMCYYQNKFRKAYDAISQEEVLGGQTAFGVFSFFIYHYLKSLIKAEVYAEVDKASKKSIKKYLSKWTKTFNKYAKFSPENFLARAYLIQASKFKVENKNAQALEMYYKTIEIAKKENKLREEATAWERASEIQRKFGNPEVADTFIEKSYAAYKTWGALGICERQKIDYPWLKNINTETTSDSIPISSKSMYALNNLDLASVLKSTAVISGEIDKEKLIKKLVLICVENAGANEGYLILKKKKAYYLSAFGDVNHNTKIFDNLLASKEPAICSKIVSYVERTQESLILGDACNDPVYGKDTYISENQIKSIFAVPIISQGDLIGFIYLLNKLTRDSFSDHQKEIINLLSGQIAISLENASLVENLEEKVRERTVEIEHEKETSEKLLLNILPRSTAKELKKTGKAMPRYYNNVSVMFIDFKNFSGISHNMDYRELVLLIDEYFRAFDDIIEKFNVEKIKTIGDAYLCVSGIPIESEDHAFQLVSAALAIQKYISTVKEEKQKSGTPYFEARIGIHSGPVVTGVVGNKKFAFDIWGDTVNIASRMESSSEIGRISISESTYQKVKTYFECHHRGKIPAKNIGELDMYFVITRK